MSFNLANPEEAENNIKKLLKSELTTAELSDKLVFDNDKPVEQLYNAVNILKDKASWTKNIGITNKKSEFERYQENPESFKPDFKFKTFPYNEKTFIELIDLLEGKTQAINQKTVKSYGFKSLEAYELQRFFEEIFEELKLFVKLASDIENKNKWKKHCERLWPMIDKKTYNKSVEKLKDMDRPSPLEKTLDAQELKNMWERELERLDLDYNIEIRDVSGCFNIPEKETVVIARGDEEERLYSETEARMLTMHELFHVLRGYNGRKAGEKIGFPPILGVHTPFYDTIEEGGALYREYETNTIYPEKEFDYHLRLVAAYLTAQDLEFREIVDRLVELGGTEERSFYLTARNREILRHHIYLQGYYVWDEADDINKLLLGKLNSRWAKTFWKEVENGVLEKPSVSADELFNFNFEN